MPSLFWLHADTQAHVVCTLCVGNNAVWEKLCVAPSEWKGRDKLSPAGAKREPDEGEDRREGRTRRRLPEKLAYLSFCFLWAFCLSLNFFQKVLLGTCCHLWCTPVVWADVRLHCLPLYTHTRAPVPKSKTNKAPVSQS